MTKSKINEVIVTPYIIPTKDNKKNAGYNLLPELYANVFICAKKKSGKTCVIGKILEECTTQYGKDRYGYFGPTTVFIISSTVDKDPTYEAIISKLTEKNITTITKRNIKDLPELLEMASANIQQAKHNDEEIEDKPKIIDYALTLAGVKMPKEEVVKKPKEKLPKKQKVSPRFIFVLDDMSGQLKDPTLNKLLKENRHYLSKVIISSQYPNDLLPEARKQIDYWLLFGGHSLDKLETMYHNADLHVSFDDFYNMYQDATQPYNFLWIDSTNSNFRHNFNLEYEV